MVMNDVIILIHGTKSVNQTWQAGNSLDWIDHLKGNIIKLNGGFSSQPGLMTLKGNISPNQNTLSLRIDARKRGFVHVTTGIPLTEKIYVTGGAAYKLHLHPKCKRLVISGITQLGTRQRHAMWLRECLVLPHPVGQTVIQKGTENGTDKSLPFYTGWWFQPLWKIWKSVGILLPNKWKN